MPDGVQGYDHYAYVSNNPIMKNDPSGHCDVLGSIGGITGIDLGHFVYSCVSDAVTAISDYSKGNRNYLALEAEFTGMKRDFLAAGHAVDALNADVASAFSNAPLSERFPHAVNLSVVAVAAAAAITGEPVGEGATAAEAGAVDEALGATCSFQSTTVVSTIAGEKTIGSLKVGDKVLAYNQKDRTKGYYAIKAVLVHADNVLTEVILNGEQIETTPEHPFFTDEKGWIPVGELKLGMHVRRADGSYGLVWWAWNVERTQVMYNLTVDTAHTYFVGQGQWLVHNDCGGTNIQKWPSTADEMDELLGFEGKRIPDGANTPGRNKVVWEPSDNVKITFEQHPYDVNAPDWHQDPHWHINWPGVDHLRFLPGDPMPGY